MLIDKLLIRNPYAFLYDTDALPRLKMLQWLYAVNLKGYIYYRVLEVLCLFTHLEVHEIK